MSRKIIDRKLFTQTVAPPESKHSLMCVNIYPDGKFNMNGKLSEKLGGKCLCIAFTEDAKNFILTENASVDNAITFPKSGSKTIPSVLDIIKRGKLTLPAKYEVWLADDNVWQGDYIENPTISPVGKPLNSKKR